MSKYASGVSVIGRVFRCLVVVQLLALGLGAGRAGATPPTWSDEFDGTGAPDPAYWTFEEGFVRNEELQLYTTDNAWQEGGQLIIEGREETVPNPDYKPSSSDWRLNREYAYYTSSSIRTRGLYSFQYGRMQVRAQIPCFTGMWPAIWTVGDVGQWPSNGECDIMEYYGSKILANCARGTTTQWVAAWDSASMTIANLVAIDPDWTTKYHVWTMQWDENYVRLYVDNILLNTSAQTWLVNPTTEWGPLEPFKQPHNIILNLAIGGTAGGDPSNTTFPQRYYVDYVRVWENYTSNTSPTDIALSSDTVDENMPAGTVVGELTATDADAAEVIRYSLVAGTGDTDNGSFEILPKSDGTLTGVLRTTQVLLYPGGATRSIRVRATDVAGATYEEILTITLNSNPPDNYAPVFTVDPITGSDAAEDAAYADTIAGSATDADGDTLTYSKVSGPAWLNVAGDGSLSGTPLPTDVGDNSFTVQVDDGNGGIDTATLNIIVLNVHNDAPVFVEDPITGASGAPDQPYFGSLEGSATDSDGDAVGYSKISGPAWLSVAVGGALSGTPASTDEGVNVFTIQADDGNGGTASATLSITVEALSAGVVLHDNFEPGVNPYGGTTPDVASYTVANTSGQANTALWVRAASGYGSSRNGLVDESENSGLNFADPAGTQAYAFRYTNTGVTTVEGIIGALTSGTTITVSFDVVMDGYNGGTAYDALLVLFDAGAARNAVEYGNKDTAAVLARSSGNVAVDGNYYTVNFSYTVGDPVVDNDGDSSTSTGTTFLTSLLGKDIALRFDGASGSANIDNVQVSVSGAGGDNTAPAWVTNPVNEADAAEDVVYSGTLAGDATDADGDTLTYAKVSGPAWLSVAADGALSGTPTNADVGLNSFTVSVSDSIATPVEATLNITVVNVNDAPVFTVDPITAAAANEGVAYSGTIAGSATDDDGDTLTYAKVSGPAWLAVAADGTLSGTPATTDIGQNSVTVSVSDGNGGSDTATLEITVNAVNNAPVWTVNPVNEADAAEDVAYSGTIAGSATDDDGDTLTYAKVSGPAWLSVAADGALSGTPTNADVGLNSFTVSVSDSIATPVEATLNITVVNVNDAPVFTVDPITAAAANEGVAYSGTIAGSATDDDGDTLTYAKVSGPAWLAVAADGALSGTPATADLGLNSFTVSVSDGIAPAVGGSLQITVLSNDVTPPVLTVPTDVVITQLDSQDPADTGQATAIDDLDPDPAVTYSDAADGADPDPYVITRTWTAADANGNLSQGIQLIIVIQVGFHMAQSETTTTGTVSGSLADTFASDNGYEVLSEAVVANKYSRLDHQWVFTVGSADLQRFYVEAYRPANVENDDFIFLYSTDGLAYTEMLTVAKSADDDSLQTYELPQAVNGTVYVRVVDTDPSTRNNLSIDSLYVDNMGFYTERWPAGMVPPGPAADPVPADSAAGISVNTQLGWTAGADSIGSDVYFGTVNPPTAAEFLTSTPAVSADPGALSYGTTYYWRVDAVGDAGTTAGAVWSFTTETLGGTPDIYVSDIAMSSASVPGGRYSGIATITVLDDLGAPVVGATVSVDWSGAAAGSGSGVTGATGQAVIESAAVKGGGTFTATVTGVTATGYTYNPALNVETSDSITAP
ncbi:MAG: tandem-95 repeat protein [Lentisphaeria bacterium]|nr:tandem-95 repeat protein [Lentisphaeria bacterium]